MSEVGRLRTWDLRAGEEERETERETGMGGRFSGEYLRLGRTSRGKGKSNELAEWQDGSADL